MNGQMKIIFIKLNKNMRNLRSKYGVVDATVKNVKRLKTKKYLLILLTSWFTVSAYCQILNAVH